MIPVLLDSAWSLQVPSVGTYRPQPIIPWRSKSAGIYQPPMSSAEVDLWSAVNAHALFNAGRIAQKILPMAVRNGDILRDGQLIVARRRYETPGLCWPLYRGGWMILDTGIYGESVIDLYAYIHGYSYRDAISNLAREAGIFGLKGEFRRQSKNHGWVQEQHPLHSNFVGPYLPVYYPVESQFEVYNNLSGHPILQVLRWQGADGSFVYLYRSLWRHHTSTISQWAEIFPQPPYPLYNVDKISPRSNFPVVLVPDEFVASGLSRTHANAFLAVPGGLKNLAKADLSTLCGRKVFVFFGPHDLEEGRRISHALQAAGIMDACFSIDEGKIIQPFAELENVAAQKRVVMLPAPIEPSQTKIVVEVGEKMPGGDQVRNFLLFPIIREGDLAWIYAEPKIGKTWFGLAMAYAASRGNCQVGKWRTSEQIGVLYVDGEMQPDDLQRSISMVMAGAGDPPGPAPFAIICAKSLPDGVVDITSEECQTTIEKALQGKNLLILDNFQSLTDNGPAALNQVRPWLRKLSQIGIAVIVLDHTNREGDLQGSVAKERIADLLIALRYPDDQAKREGRLLVEYPRARRLHGADEEPFQLRKIFTESTFKLEVVEPDTSTHFDVSPQIARLALVVCAKDHEGLSYPDIQKKYDIPQSTAHGDYKKAGTLSGDDKAAFDQELQRLIAERPQIT